MSNTLNKTDSRVTALAEIKGARVTYDPRVGKYTVKLDDGTEEVARGARRRTFAELRGSGLVESASVSTPSPIKLTARGEDVAEEWEID